MGTLKDSSVQVGDVFTSGGYKETFTVVDELAERSKDRRKQYLCLTESGEEIVFTGKALLRLRTRRKKPRVCKEHVLYRTYASMKSRCYNENTPNYRWWGARGITVCDRWLSSFWNFVEDMGERPEGFTLERVDNEKEYSPENCKWASVEENNRNRRPNSGWARKKCQQ